jgi:hypothetical protein
VNDINFDSVGIYVGADPATKMVLLRFGAPINRLDLDPKSATDLAQSLISRAMIAQGMTGDAPDKEEST